MTLSVSQHSLDLSGKCVRLRLVGEALLAHQGGLETRDEAHRGAACLPRGTGIACSWRGAPMPSTITGTAGSCRLTLLAGGAAVAATIPGVALAQDQGAEPDAGLGSNVIIVTASKRGRPCRKPRSRFG
jgi:hypothetical protein